MIGNGSALISHDMSFPAGLRVNEQQFSIGESLNFVSHDLPTLFEQFRRGSSRDSRAQKGAGLGLRFVAVTLQRHHGTVRVNSTPGCGSEFVLSLPRMGIQ